MTTLKAMAVEPEIPSPWEEQLAGYIMYTSFRVLSLGNTESQIVTV